MILRGDPTKEAQAPLFSNLQNTASTGSKPASLFSPFTAPATQADAQPAVAEPAASSEPAKEAVSSSSPPISDQAAPAPSAGLFGQPPAAKPQSLFGSFTPQNKPNSLFGSVSASSQSQPAGDQPSSQPAPAPAATTTNVFKPAPLFAPPASIFGKPQTTPSVTEPGTTTADEPKAETSTSSSQPAPGSQAAPAPATSNPSPFKPAALFTPPASIFGKPQTTPSVTQPATTTADEPNAETSTSSSQPAPGSQAAPAPATSNPNSSPFKPAALFSPPSSIFGSSTAQSTAKPQNTTKSASIFSPSFSAPTQTTSTTAPTSDKPAVAQPASTEGQTESKTPGEIEAAPAPKKPQALFTPVFTKPANLFGGSAPATSQPVAATGEQATGDSTAAVAASAQPTAQSQPASTFKQPAQLLFQPVFKPASLFGGTDTVGATAEPRPKKTHETCTVCKQLKPEAEFSKSQWRQKDSKCKACIQAAQPVGPHMAACSVCGEKKEKSGFSKSQWKTKLENRKCLVCTEKNRQANMLKGQEQKALNEANKAATKATKQESKGNVSKKYEQAKKLLLKTTALEKLLELRKLIDDSKKVIEATAPEIATTPSAEFAVILNNVDEMLKTVFAVRGHDASKATFKQVRDPFSQSPVFSTKQCTGWFDVVGQAQPYLKANPDAELTDDQKQVILESAWKLIHHLESNVTDFLCSKVFG